MNYAFYGAARADVPAVSPPDPAIRTPRDLYDALSHVWCAETCAPRMRKDWTPENPTLGQCSVTAFLAQDIFGGRVWGVPLPEGGFHCFNVVENRVFDLTNEQFGDQELDYALRHEQLRHEHFMQPGKQDRYEMLKEGLAAYLAGK